jgi:hypothetical protein
METKGVNISAKPEEHKAARDVVVGDAELTILAAQHCHLVCSMVQREADELEPVARGGVGVHNEGTPTSIVMRHGNGDLDQRRARPCHPLDELSRCGADQLLIKCLKEVTLPFFRIYTIRRQHARTLTPMNTHTQALPHVVYH